MQTDTDPAAVDVRADGLVARVRELARTSGDDPAVSFADYARDPDGRIRTMTYAELDRRARAVAAALQARAPEGSRVAVVCPHEISYVLAFLGCLYAGLVAVPLPAPDVHRTRDRIGSVLADAEPALVLTTERTADRVTPLLDALPERPRLLVIDELAEEDARHWREPRISAGSLAYLQYTSGSTGAPSGVRVTHGNLAANVWQIANVTVYLKPRSAIVSWVPFFHDMGLVMGLAVPLAAGVHSVHLGPTDFIQSPYRWLRLVSDFRAVWTGGPNFAYELCVDRVSEAQKRTLDLSCLEGLVNGSETVRPHSMDRFNRAFASCGLREGLDGPSYGLAEATLGVTGPPAENKPDLVHSFDRAALADGRVEPRPDGAPASRRMVACGVPLEDVHIRIVDPNSRVEAGEGRVGEIWVQGPNVADGYWRRPERTEEVFRARCTGRDGEPVLGEWLRTGDLGFLHEGQLFIAGRLKDLVIVGGGNHDPADVEATVQSALEPHGLGSGGTAVFSVDADGGERVVAVVEIRRQEGVDADRVRADVRRAVSDGHGIALSDVVLTPWGGIPRTSSRKVQRGLCRDHYVRGELTALGAQPVAAP
ncbi:fatty acyl-AMP ligase [Streptomyces glaucosporus]|uniref:Fatty acyl-AMP ligase n=1 Tax=Streptomyces glaucosporus TaxID=284044 RepID=A0ABP5UK97_9ACTN